MRILLDQNMPIGVRRILTGHDVRAAPEMGWACEPLPQRSDSNSDGRRQ
jgi:hypothetical protein